MFLAGASNEPSAAQPERLSSGLTSAGEPRGVSGTERPIKVCFISALGYGLYRPESGYPFGGAEVQFFLLSRELSADEAFQVSVLTTVGEAPGEERLGALTVVKRLGLGRLGPRAGRTRWEPLGAAPRYASAFWAMYRILRAIDADVYLHAGAGVEVGAYALISRLLRRRFVFLVVSDADLSNPYTRGRGLLRWLFPIGLRLADGVVCQTREHQAWLRERYGIEGVLIRTGHPTVKRTGQQRSTVLWVGRTHPLKQPQMFLDLVERLAKERCVMVIMRHPAYQGLMTAVRERAGTLTNLTVHEDVPLSDMDQYFEQAKLFINTSTYEGFPNTFVQAA
ncbi:MAG: glycosyltransferase, partial [Nitrospiraceae bacterium]